MATPGAGPGGGPGGSPAQPGNDMETLWKQAQGEYSTKGAVERLSEMWFTTSEKLGEARKSLHDKAAKLPEFWRDDTYPIALGNHIDNGVEEIEKATMPAYQVGETLTTVASVIESTYWRVRDLYEQYQKNLATRDYLIGHDSLPNPALDSGWMKQIDEAPGLAREALDELAGWYRTAETDLARASEQSAWTGPTAAKEPAPPTAPVGPSAPVPAGPPGAEQPGDQLPSGEQAGGGQPGGEQAGGGPPGGHPGEQPGGEPGGQPGDKPGGPTGGGTGGPGDIPGPGAPGGADTELPSDAEPPPDTSLSGGETGAPPTLPRIPDASVSPSVPPGGSGFGGGGVGGGFGGAGAAGGGPARIEQAARNLTAPDSPGIGQGPGSAAHAAQAAGTPIGAGGRTPMIPPMIPPGTGTGAGANGDGKPRPGTAQAVGSGKSRPAGPATGVPAGLRGRTGTNEASTAARTASRRIRRDGPQTVELLDSELWEVEAMPPANDQSTSPRTGTPRPAT